MTDVAGRSVIAWFSALCDDDYEYLGVPDRTLRSSWAHCRDIVTTAEANGFDNVLLPSGYALGIDGVPFAGGIAAIADRIKVLLAVRCGEMWPPQLARQLAGLDEMLDGRLTINIISSDLPGNAAGERSPLRPHAGGDDDPAHAPRRISDRPSAPATRTSTSATSSRSTCCRISDRLQFGFSSGFERSRRRISPSARVPPLSCVNNR